MNWKCLLMLFLSAVFPALALAQGGRNAAAQRAARGDASTIAEIQDQLASNNPAQQKQAIAAIRSRIQARGIAEIKTFWSKPLLAAKLYKDAAEIAQEAILASPGETRYVEAALELRIKALLGAGQLEEALNESKSLFNVASMPGTAEAILTVAECISTARPKDIDLFNRFRDEQMAGAQTPAPATQPANHPARRCTVLDSIKVNPKPYQEAMAHFTGEDAASLMARGNLLLMADKPREARQVFERMYSLSGAELAEATEALARAMKAEDGTIGRANAWILSLRPSATRVRPTVRE